MDDINKSKIFELYTLAELAYQKQFKSNNDNIESLYPIGWYKNKDYKKKIEIITESIKTNTLIEDTSGYKELVKKERNVLIKKISEN